MWPAPHYLIRGQHAQTQISSGGSTVAYTRRRPRTHNETQNTVAAFGEVTHTPDFMPAPPSRISERGPEAEIVWRTRWAEGNGNNLNEYDLDQIAAAASE